MNCPNCKVRMTLLQEETAIAHSWGMFTLWGCDECKIVYWERTGDTTGIKKEKKKKPVIYRPKPIYDPIHHHDHHLIN